MLFDKPVLEQGSSNYRYGVELLCQGTGRISIDGGIRLTAGKHGPAIWDGPSVSHAFPELRELRANKGMFENHLDKIGDGDPGRLQHAADCCVVRVA